MRTALIRDKSTAMLRALLFFTFMLPFGWGFESICFKSSLTLIDDLDFQVFLTHKDKEIEQLKSRVNPEIFKSYLPLIEMNLQELREAVELLNRKEITIQEARELTDISIKNLNLLFNELRSLVTQQIQAASEASVKFSHHYEKAMRNHYQAQKKLEEVVIPKILNNPQIGSMKNEIPNKYRFMHFHSNSVTYVVSYEFQEGVLIIHYVAPHENFYRDFMKIFGFVT